MPAKPAAQAAPKAEFTIVAGRKLSKGQLAYEQERAKQAGKSLDDWMKAKVKAEAVEAQKTVVKPAKKPGFFSRLIEKGHKPI